MITSFVSNYQLISIGTFASRILFLLNSLSYTDWINELKFNEWMYNCLNKSDSIHALRMFWNGILQISVIGLHRIVLKENRFCFFASLQSESDEVSQQDSENSILKNKLTMSAEVWSFSEICDEWIIFAVQSCVILNFEKILNVIFKKWSAIERTFQIIIIVTNQN